MRLAAAVGLLFLWGCGSETAGVRPDLVRLSESWWGTSIEMFPAKAGLGPGESSRGDHPTEKGVKVLFPAASKSGPRWDPVELPPAFFEFPGDLGLQTISGFYKGSKLNVVAALQKRYGAETRTVKALSFVTYVWEFDRTVLEVTDVHFQIFPKGRRNAK